MGPRSWPHRPPAMSCCRTKTPIEIVQRTEGQSDANGVREYVGSGNGDARGEVAHGLSLDGQAAIRILGEILDAGWARKECERRGTRYFAAP